MVEYYFSSSALGIIKKKHRRSRENPVFRVVFEFGINFYCKTSLVADNLQAVIAF